MSEKIELVTPLYNFLNNPTSSTYLSALEYLSKKDAEISEYEVASLNLFNTESVMLDDELDFYQFNERLWNCLDDFDLSIDWESYLIKEKENKKISQDIKNKDLEKEPEKIIEPLSGEILQLVTNYAEATFKRASDNENLHYFKDINKLLKTSDDYMIFEKYSSEVSDYLRQINPEFKEFSDYKKKLLNEELWLWAYLTTCRIYELYLIKNKKEYNQAIELSLTVSFIILNLIFQHSKKLTFRIYNACYKKIISNTKIKEKRDINKLLEISQSCISSEENIDKELSTNVISTDNLFISQNLIGAIFSFLNPVKLVPRSANDVLVNSYLSKSTDVY